MTEQSGPETPDPVGSLAEEAAKLFGALADRTREQGAAASSADDLVDRLRHVNDHLAGEDCRYCPLCRLIQAVRETSPEVRAHLGVAAASLVQAAAGFLATHPPTRPETPVERIDLDDADPPPPES